MVDRPPASWGGHGSLLDSTGKGVGLGHSAVQENVANIQPHFNFKKSNSFPDASLEILMFTEWGRATGIYILKELICVLRPLGHTGLILLSWDLGSDGLGFGAGLWRCVAV